MLGGWQGGDRSRKGCGGDHVHPHVPPIPSPCWPPRSGISQPCRGSLGWPSQCGVPCAVSSSPDRTGRCNLPSLPCLLSLTRGAFLRASSLCQGGGLLLVVVAGWSQECSCLRVLGPCVPATGRSPAQIQGRGGGWIPRPFHPHRLSHAVCSSSPATAQEWLPPAPSLALGLTLPMRRDREVGASPAVTGRQGEASWAEGRRGAGIGQGPPLLTQEVVAPQVSALAHEA